MSPKSTATPITTAGRPSCPNQKRSTRIMILEASTRTHQWTPESLPESRTPIIRIQTREDRKLGQRHKDRKHDPHRRPLKHVPLHSQTRFKRSAKHLLNCETNSVLPHCVNHLMNKPQEAIQQSAPLTTWGNKMKFIQTLCWFLAIFTTTVGCSSLNSNGNGLNL